MPRPPPLAPLFRAFRPPPADLSSANVTLLRPLLLRVPASFFAFTLPHPSSPAPLLFFLPRPPWSLRTTIYIGLLPLLFSLTHCP